MMPTAVLACCMASLAVETMGNTPISAKALRNHLEDLLQLSSERSLSSAVTALAAPTS